jgi:hypothetical protein
MRMFPPGCAGSAALALIAAVALSGQSPADLFSKAPPEIDNALRERITGFYQAHVDGKFRVADQYVSEDSKDIFFEADKRRCRSFQIVKINYEENFTRARAVVNCDTEMLLPPKGVMQVKMPVASSWRLESGNWFWFVEGKGNQSPFGSMNPGQGDGAVQIPKGPSAEDLRKMIEVSESEFRVSPDEVLTREIKVTNKMPGAVQLTLDAIKATDIKASFDHVELKPQESATLTIQFTPDRAHRRSPRTSEEIVFSVAPTNQKLRVRFFFVN